MLFAHHKRWGPLWPITYLSEQILSCYVCLFVRRWLVSPMSARNSLGKFASSKAFFTRSFRSSLRSVVLQLPFTRSHKYIPLWGSELESAWTCACVSNVSWVMSKFLATILMCLQTLLMRLSNSSFGLPVCICHSASQHKILFLVDGCQANELYDMPNRSVIV